MEESVSAPRKGINLWSVEQESKKSKLRLVRQSCYKKDIQDKTLG